MDKWFSYHDVFKDKQVNYKDNNYLLNGLKNLADKL